MEEFDIIVKNEEPLDASPEIKDDFIRGEKGEKGDANKLTIGTVTKGEEASATITGESPNQILNLVLPKGDTGKEGKQGIPGEKGQDGYTPIKGEDYFTEAEIQQIKQDILADISTFDLQVVETLPTENIQEKTIYLVPNAEAKENNVYDEYIYVNSTWEIIGSTAVDLTDYYNKTEVDEKIDNIQALPVGGTTGQVLTKQSDTDGDAGWGDIEAQDNIPVGAIIEYDGDTVPEGYQKVGERGEIYSTEEVRIGTWIDGKPLYRRFIDFGLIGIDSQTVYMSYGSEFETLVKINSYVSYGTGLALLPIQTKSLFIYSNVSVSNGVIQAEIYRNSSGAWGDHNLKAIIEYTKTTD